MESRKSVQNLANSIRSLLGLNTHLTSSWANSVCIIIKDLTSEEPDNGSQIKSPDFNNAGSIVNKDVDLGDSVSKIQGDLAALNAHLNHLNLQRRQALNDFLDLKGKIRVFCRIRPIIEGEKFGPQGPIVASYSNNVLLKLAENKSKCYIFDKVFHPSSSQDEVFSEVGQVIKSALDGYNVCIFAYGQTGTGKTFTMEGTPGSPGVVPRAMEALFKQAVDSNHKFLFTFSMLEIYMGNLRDLLVPQATKPTDPMPKCLSIQTDSNGEIEIDNLVAIQVSEFNQVLKLYRLGSRFRSTASTNSNATSSRSHCLIRISLTCFDASERRRETNKIWMVDLGGSERVLKTKACGRRFEEGRAINLSLSALGDVISALQRRKSHIPYRNSKLTQVLKDSLGEDSKTLMLVHVSPKEEDLCETVCSLGFATRVRSVQLGNEESPEIRANKEVAMMKLLQKVKQLECEREDIRRDIEKLNERLKDLLGTVLSSNEHLEAPHPSSELLHSTVEMEKHSIGDVKAPSQPPSFMRPTVSSRRKSGIDYQSSESVQKNYPPSARRKRPSSLRAESVTFPIKDVSEYGSECSTSRTSCLVDLNMKHSADYETEYSLDASECDIKVVVFPEKEKSPRSLTRSKTLGYGNRKANKIDSTKFLKIDHWFRRQKDESTSRTNTHRSNWMPAIPVPEKTNKRNEQNEAEILHKEKANNHGFTKKKISNHDKIEKLAGIGVLGRSIAEVVIGEAQNLLDDFVSEASGSNPISLCQKTKDKLIEETQVVLDNFSNNDNGHGPIHPPNTEGDRVKQGINYGQVIGTFVKQKVMEEKQNSLKDFLLKESGCNLFSPSDMGSSIINQNYESHVPISKSELESKSQMFPTETLNEVIVGSKSTNMIDQKVQTEDLISNGNTSEEDSEKADLFGSPQYIEAVTRPSLDTMKSRRALFIDRKEEDREDTMTVIGSQVNIQNTGIFHLLEQKVRTLFASALLGSGIQNLGLGHDFFDGLLL